MAQGMIFQNACALHAPPKVIRSTRCLRSHRVACKDKSVSRASPAAAGASSESPKEEEQVLQPPSTVKGISPAGDGVDTKGSEEVSQQGSAPEDASAEYAAGSKNDSLADASGASAESVKPISSQCCCCDVCHSMRS